MKQRINLFLYIFLSFFSSAFAQDKEMVLRDLDKLVAKKEEYRQVRYKEIDGLNQQKIHLNASDPNPLLVGVYEQLYQNYSHFQSDSALHYINLLLATDDVKNNKVKYTNIMLNRAEMLAITGDYTGANAITDKICANDLDSLTRTRYYHVCRTINGWMADYMRHMPDIESTLIELTAHYRDSIISIERDEISRNIVIADRFLNNNQCDSALQILTEIEQKAEGQQLSYIYYILSEVCKKQKNPDLQFYYLALTAIEDLKRGVTEYTALQTLAAILFEQGDVDRAYNYMFCSLEDANFCGARLRSVEVSEIYPIVEKAYKKSQMKALHTQSIITGSIAIIALILVIGLVLLNRKNNVLDHTRKQLADANMQLEAANNLLGNTNSDLQKANSNLKTMDKIKEDYIAIYLSRCRDYLEDIEKYRKSVLKLAKSKHHDELMKLLKDDSFFSDEQLRFYKDFDEAFLELHPNFVDGFNTLLLEEDKIVPKKGEKLTTELRIFALIRMGVSDTAQIAHFLNYSMPTIYNYRSRIKNKSKYEKEEFEERLMQL